MKLLPSVTALIKPKRPICEELGVFWRYPNP